MNFLDPIFREKTYNPRLMYSHRPFIIGVTLLVLFVILLSTLGGLIGFFGFRVPGQTERNKYGLQLIPDLHQLSGGVFQYSRRLDMNATRQAYVNELNKFLDIYVNEQKSRAPFVVDCAEGQKADNKWCRFDLTRAFQKDGRGCTRYDTFGYDNGSPCILFAFKDEIQWKPKVAKNVTEIPFKCEIKPNRGSSKPSGTFYFPAMQNNPRLAGFPINKLPSITVKDLRGDVTDEDGETIYDMPPLVFVKLSLPDVAMHYTVTCAIRSDVPGNEIANMKDFGGRSSFTFDINVT